MHVLVSADLVQLLERLHNEVAVELRATLLRQDRLPLKYIYDHSFWGDSVKSFFRLGLSTRFSELEFSFKWLRLSAVFGGRLKRPSPYRTRSAPGRDRVRGLSETSEKCANFLYFGRYTPELFLDLGICRA